MHEVANSDPNKATSKCLKRCKMELLVGELEEHNDQLEIEILVKMFEQTINK